MQTEEKKEEISNVENYEQSGSEEHNLVNEMDNFIEEKYENNENDSTKYSENEDKNKNQKKKNARPEKSLASARTIKSQQTTPVTRSRITFKEKWEFEQLERNPFFDYFVGDNRHFIKFENSKYFVEKSSFFSGSFHFATLQIENKTSTPTKVEEKKEEIKPNPIFEKKLTESPSSLIFTITTKDKKLFAIYQKLETHEFFIVSYKLQKVINPNITFRKKFNPYWGNKHLFNYFNKLLHNFGLSWEDFKKCTNKI